MTDYERNKIVALQSEGYGYKKIAKELDLSVNTVKTFCRRRTAIKSDGKVRCLYCGSVVEQTPHRKKKKYCSDSCRMAWWKEHPEMIQRKNSHAYICLECGISFVSKNPGRVYCSRECYANARRKEVA
ncbi:MAG: helix-turn-helix domain-containing protein [Oscillospiraceae bacterium]|nr:helix-turn-helix domain-containing protein [Oscillospiraceae bacterium]